jgi:hypothetical protein
MPRKRARLNSDTFGNCKPAPKPQKGAADETCYQVPKSVTPAKELQTKSSPSNPTGQDAVRLPPGAIWSETKNHRL